ncbi:Rxlr-like protein, partial [Globisporangium splendens]
MVLAHQDAWRKHPFITGCAKKPFPGLGIASAIFGAYLVVDLVAGGSSSAHGASDGDHYPKSASKVKYSRDEIGERPTVQQ